MPSLSLTPFCILSLFIASVLAQQTEDPHPFLPYNVRHGLLSTATWGEFITGGYYENGTTANGQHDALLYFAYNKVKIKQNNNNQRRLDSQAEKRFIDLENRVLSIDYAQPNWVTVDNNPNLELMACVNHTLGYPVNVTALSAQQTTIYNSFKRSLADLRANASLLAYQSFPLSCSDSLSRCINYTHTFSQVPLAHHPLVPLYCERAMADPSPCTNPPRSIFLEFVCELGYAEACVDTACGAGSSPVFSVNYNQAYTCVCDRVYARSENCSIPVACTLPGCSQDPELGVPPLNQDAGAVLLWVKVRWYILGAGLFILLLGATFFVILSRKKKQTGHTQRKLSAIPLSFFPVAHVISMVIVLLWGGRVLPDDERVRLLVIVMCSGAVWNLLAFSAFHLTHTPPVNTVSPQPPYTFLSELLSTLAIAFINMLALLAVDVLDLRSSHLTPASAFSLGRSPKAQWWLCIGVLGTFLTQTLAGGILQGYLLQLSETGSPPPRLLVVSLALTAAAGVCRLFFLWPLVKYYRRATFALKGPGNYTSPPPNAAAARVLMEEYEYPDIQNTSGDDWRRGSTDSVTEMLYGDSCDSPYVNTLWRRGSTDAPSVGLSRAHTCPTQRTHLASLETLVAPGNELVTVTEEEEEASPGNSTSIRKRAQTFTS